MPYLRRSISCVLLLILICSTAAADDLQLVAGDGMRWMKGNMHTHSLWSDGDDYPEMIASWYRDRDYQFLVFTDHNVLHNTERWIDIDRNKGGRPAFEKLIQAFPEGWVETRTVSRVKAKAAGNQDDTGEDEVIELQEVRLKQFDEVFDRIAEPGRFLLIQGEEVTDAFGRLPVHLCATHLTELLPPMHGDSVTDTIQNNVSAAVARRERTGEKSLIHLNHPNFGWAVTAEQLMPIVGERFFEVYNGHPSVRNNGDETHASTERIWDIINTWRLAKLDLPLMYGLATDDGHNYHIEDAGRGSQPGRGWVMVLTDSLDPDSLIAALEEGHFYSSSGVTLSAIRWQDGVLEIDVDSEPNVEYRIDIIGTRRGFNDTTLPASEDETKANGLTRLYSEDVGEVLMSVSGTSIRYESTGDELYVRGVVTSSRKHPNPAEPDDAEQAWTQPIRVAAPPNRDDTASK